MQDCGFESINMKSVFRTSSSRKGYQEHEQGTTTWPCGSLGASSKFLASVWANQEWVCFFSPKSLCRLWHELVQIVPPAMLTCSQAGVNMAAGKSIWAAHWVSKPAFCITCEKLDLCLFSSNLTTSGTKPKPPDHSFDLQKAQIYTV